MLAPDAKLQVRSSRYYRSSIALKPLVFQLKIMLDLGRVNKQIGN
jgi:hypothetical protein